MDVLGRDLVYGTIIKDYSAKEEEYISCALDIAKNKYCPAVKDNCKCEGCAFFTISRPCADTRIFRATCTYTGTRHLVQMYGMPKDRFEDGTLMYEEI